VDQVIYTLFLLCTEEGGMRDRISSWAVIDHDTLTKVFAMLPFNVKLDCESVCVTWRQALRHRPAAGVWDKSLLLTDTRQHFGLEGPPSVLLDLALANSQLAERITAVSNWLRQRASGFHSVSFGREYGLQLDDLQKVDYIYQLVNALGQAHSLPAVRVYVKCSSWLSAHKSHHKFVLAVGPTVLQLAQFPELVATNCQVMRLAPDVSSEQLHNIKALSNLSTLILELGPRWRPVSTQPLTDHGRLLAEIAQLPHLHHLQLHNLAAPLGGIPTLSQLSNLRDLWIKSSIEGPYDFQLCTQLTSLDFSAKHEGSNVLLLPRGELANSNRVSLETFKLTAPCVVRNLAFATELRLIDMAPVSFTDSDVDWPVLLPKLERFEDCISDFGHPIHDLPQEWIGYSNLTHICLNTFEANDLPVWFSSLQHLKSLERCHAKFPQFPTCLIAMSGLEHLELNYLDTYLSQDILSLALLPRLTTLRFGNFSAIGRRLDNVEVMNLRRLELFCCAHFSGIPLLQQGDEGNWDFEATPPQYMTPRDRVRVEALLKILSEVFAVQQ